MKKIWINKPRSFKEAEEFEFRYYREMSPSQRLDTMQYLRELDLKIKGENDARSKRLRRVITVVQQEQC